MQTEHLTATPEPNAANTYKVLLNGEFFGYLYQPAEGWLQLSEQGFWCLNRGPLALRLRAPYFVPCKEPQDVLNQIETWWVEEFLK